MTIKQHTAHGSMLGGSFQLIPPRSEDFSVYGGIEVIEAARTWALANQLVLFDGPADSCVHGLYRMDSCPTEGACHTVGMDHTNIWVRHDGQGAFILTHPYQTEIPAALVTYADMHALTITTSAWDNWYPGTLPIRLTIPGDWPLWPIERDAIVVLHTQPITWPK